MNKSLLGLLLLVMILIGLTFWLRKENSMSPNLVTYMDPQEVFTFDYPKAFSVTEEDGVVRVHASREYMPQTNFSEADLRVGHSSGGTDASCQGTTTSTDAAAGNRYETTTYKKIYDGDCYIFESVIHSTNLGNYDPSQGIKEFDHDRVKSDLEEIVESFHYLVNSD